MLAGKRNGYTGKAYVMEGVSNKRKRVCIEANYDKRQHENAILSDATKHVPAISARKNVKEMPIMSISLRAFVRPAIMEPECVLIVGGAV